MKKIIETRDLRKIFKIEIKKEGFLNRFKSIFKPEYKEFEAVSGINLVVGEGEKIAFLGPNGAGKSTTIKMLTGILNRTSGNITVCGLDPTLNRKKLVYVIGAVFGQTSRLWYHLSAIDTFKLIGKMFDMKNTEIEERITYLVGRFGIEDIINLPVRKLSLGQRMKCEIVASLMHKPLVIFLDEHLIL
ncbi:MAG: ATP-binding cassette domain-containing protein [Candidatus Gracilibacteria bacterium]|nr:ATP-binding cassette domain-containing protein [Candidatus Gracilibacteria bacterium]